MAKLLASDQMRPPLRSIAGEVAARARSTAPVQSGAYKDSITEESATTDRAVERVVAHATHALAVEAKHGTLKRALGG
jgi:hypothetical protein